MSFTGPGPERKRQTEWMRMKSMKFGFFRRVAFFAVVAVASAAFSAPQASAILLFGCPTALDASEAQARCPDLRAHAVWENGVLKRSRCGVKGSCALTVPVGGSDTSFHLSIPGSLFFDYSDVWHLDFCFARAADAGEGQGGWTMSLKPGCDGGEIDSATAAAGGLEAPE